MSDPPESAWWYVQVYFEDAARRTEASAMLVEACDTLLSPVLQALLQGLRPLFERFFFIRYAEEGYHLRLRIQGDPVAIATHVQPLVEQAILAFFSERQALLQLPGGPLTIEALREARRLRYPRYQPEYAKYGGREGVLLAEEHHQVSSELCWMVLDAERQARIARSQFALELTLILATLFSSDPQEQALLLSAHTDYWLGWFSPALDVTNQLEAHYQRQKQRLSQRFAPGEPGELERFWHTRKPALFRAWRSHLQEHIDRLRRLELSGGIETALAAQGAPYGDLLSRVPTIARTPTVALRTLPNYLHMLHNRLGLSPRQEAQMTYLLYRFLEDRHAIVAGTCPLDLEPALPP